MKLAFFCISYIKSVTADNIDFFCCSSESRGAPPGPQI